MFVYKYNAIWSFEVRNGSICFDFDLVLIYNSSMCGNFIKNK